MTREHLRQALKRVQQVLEHAGAAPQPSQSYDWFLNDTATSAAGTAMVSPAAPPAVVERAVTALPTGPSPAKISSATSETSSAPSVTASSPVGAVIQPPVPPDAKVIRANNLDRERTVQEYNALLNETMRPLTQFTSNDVAKGFGHVYVSADTLDKYFSTVDSIDIHHPGGWFLRLRGRSNARDLYKTDAHFRGWDVQAAENGDRFGGTAHATTADTPSGTSPAEWSASGAGVVAAPLHAMVTGAHTRPVLHLLVALMGRFTAGVRGAPDTAGRSGAAAARLAYTGYSVNNSSTFDFTGHKVAKTRILSKWLTQLTHLCCVLSLF